MDGLGDTRVAGEQRTQHAYLDVHLGTLQEAQSGVACAVRAQGYQLLELFQVEPEFSSSERARDRLSS